MLMSPMRQDLGLSVAEIALPLNVYRLVQAIFLVPAGSLLDKVGPVKALRISILAAAVFGLLFPLCTNLPQLVFLQVVFAVTKLFGGLSAMLMLVSQAFENKSGMGTATSILLGGYSLAGFLAPALVGSLYQSFGWRVSAGIVAALFACIGVPLTLLYLSGNRSNENKSEARQASKKTDDVASPSKDPTSRPPVAEPLLSSRYVLLAGVVAAFSFSMHIVLDHFLVFLREDMAMSFKVGTKYVSALNLVALFAKLGVGPLSDSYDKGVLLLLFSVVGLIASLFLFDITSVGALVVTASLRKIMSFITVCKFFLFSLRNFGEDSFCSFHNLYGIVLVHGQL